jgi:ADP-ribose pyrophosphatase YjhB (NUDIX family)
MIGPPDPPAAVARRCGAYAGGVELPSTLGRLAAELPVPVRRLGYRWAYNGLRVYWFLRRPDTSGVKCVLTDEDRILLVRHSYGPRGWDLPGGSIRPGEAPEDAARREMNEELGIAIHDFGLLDELVVRSEHREDHVHCFTAELRAPRLTIDRGELVTAAWFPRQDLPSELGQYVQRIVSALPPAK